MGMLRPLVTVVMATNRAGEFLDEALSSLAAQTEPRFELIAVDDGSPDPGAVARAVGSVPRSTLIRQEPAGPAAARNAAVQLAEGEWLAFLDDDDRWHPERLAAQLARLREHPEAVASYCGLRTIDEHGAVLVESDQRAIGGRLDIARRTTGILLPNLMVSKRAFDDAGGFDPVLRLGEDFDLLLPLAERGSIVFEPRVLVDYRAHGANVTSRYRELVRAIDGILRQHREAAVARDDGDLVAALDESIRKNDRFAWWSAARSAKAALVSRHPLDAAAELLWALRTAPRGLVDGVGRRLRGGAAPRR